MRRVSIAVVASVSAAAVVLVPGSAADAKSKKKAAPVPTVTKVSPMRVKVGRTITIRGKNFSSTRKRNAVLFKGAGGRSAIAKVSRASSKKLVVKVPPAVEQLLTKKAGKGVATKLKLRVVTKRYGKLSSRRHSPVVLTGLK